MNISGNYSCVMRQEKGPALIRRYGTLSLQSDGGRLRGTMFPTMYWLDSPFTGGSCAEDGSFSFRVHFSTPCQQFFMDVSGKVTNGVLTGAVNSPMGEYILEGARIDPAAI